MLKKKRNKDSMTCGTIYKWLKLFKCILREKRENGAEKILEEIMA